MGKNIRIRMLLIIAAITLFTGAVFFLSPDSWEKLTKNAKKAEMVRMEPLPLASEKRKTYRDETRRLEFQFPESYRLQWGVNGVLLKTAEHTIVMPIDDTGYNFEEIYERAASPEEFAIEMVSGTYTADGPDGSHHATQPQKFLYKTPNELNAMELYLTIVDETYLDEGETIEKRTEVPIYIVSLSEEPYRSFLAIRFLDHEGKSPGKEILREIADSVKVLGLARSDELLHDCETKLTAKFDQWRFAPVSQEVAESAKAHQENPTITYGDFDGDGIKDIALLIQHGTNPNPDYPQRDDSLHIAVCLNTKAGVNLYLIDSPYCGDGIALSRKGHTYYDYDTGNEGTYKLDGVSAYCFKKAGATYEFENGTFRQIVDSD